MQHCCCQITVIFDKNKQSERKFILSNLEPCVKVIQVSDIGPVMKSVKSIDVVYTFHLILDHFI